MLSMGDKIDIELKKVAENVYHANIPDSCNTLPVVVYKLPSSISGEIREDFNLVIDIWGDSLDTRNLEQIVVDISQALDRKKFLLSDIAFKLYKNGQFEMEEPEENLERRRLSFECKTYNID
jgi:hypothetical protein